MIPNWYLTEHNEQQWQLSIAKDSGDILVVLVTYDKGKMFLHWAIYSSAWLLVQ